MKILILILYFAFSLLSQDIPEWILYSSDNQYIYGVGYSSKNGSFGEKLKIAKMVARANLSENISVNVSSSFEKDISNKKTTVNYSTIQKSKNLLKNSFTKEKWISKDGEIFILIAIEK